MSTSSFPVAVGLCIAMDHIDINYSWRGNEGHKILNAGIFADGITLTFGKSDLRPISGQSFDLPFTGDVVDLSALPVKLPGAADAAAAILSKDVTHLVIRQAVPDAAPVPFTADLDGVVDATTPDCRVGLSIQKMAAELDGSARHVTGFFRIQTTTDGAEPVE